VEPRSHCWICGSPQLRLARRSLLDAPLTPDSFAITDAHYGRTPALDRCERCGFLQCSELAEVTPYYEALEDPEYEETRLARSAQMRRLLERLARVRAPRARDRLLDVGAGSGALVEEAARMGYRATGIEPSRWLQERALARGLDVARGTLPHPDRPGPFDVITLIDVIEHVQDPVGLLRAVAPLLAPDGVVVIVTPDVRSLPARLLGWRWWHFRVAHVGYFDRRTLDLALERTGLRREHVSRPSWSLPLGYLWERLRAYLPIPASWHLPAAADRIALPLNLRDSLFVIARRREGPA
jgi:SAM-dependent methyltransferase